MMLAVLNRFNISVFFFILFNGCTYDPPKELLYINNHSISDTIVLFVGNCEENLDKSKPLELIYFDKGFNEIIPYPHMINPLDSGKLAIGYSIDAIVNSCKSKRVNIYVFSTKIIRRTSWEKICDNHLEDTIFQITAQSIKKFDYY